MHKSFCIDSVSRGVGKCAICSYGVGKYVHALPTWYKKNHGLCFPWHFSKAQNEFYFQGWQRWGLGGSSEASDYWIRNVMRISFLLWMFLFRLYGDLWGSQIPLLNLRKGICETNSYSHLWESDAMAQSIKCSCPDELVQSLGCCRGSMTISSPFHLEQNGEVYTLTSLGNPSP